MEALTPGHLIVLLIAVILLAGYRKLPDAARSIGRSLRIFRGELRAADEESLPAFDERSAAMPTTAMTAMPTGAREPGPVPTFAPRPGSVERLEQEAADAEALAARLRARAASAQEGPPAPTR